MRKVDIKVNELFGMNGRGELRLSQRQRPYDGRAPRVRADHSGWEEDRLRTAPLHPTGPLTTGASPCRESESSWRGSRRLVTPPWSVVTRARFRHRTIGPAGLPKRR